MVPQSTERLRAVASILRCREVERLGRLGKGGHPSLDPDRNLAGALMLGEKAVPLHTDEVQD